MLPRRTCVPLSRSPPTATIGGPVRSLQEDRIPWGGVGAVCGSPAGVGSGGHGGQPELVSMPKGGEGPGCFARAAAPRPRGRSRPRSVRCPSRRCGVWSRRSGAPADWASLSWSSGRSESHVGQDVIIDLVHGPGKAGEARAKAVGDHCPRAVSWVKMVAARSGDQGPLPRSDLSEQVAQDMDPSPVVRPRSRAARRAGRAG